MTRILITIYIPKRKMSINNSSNNQNVQNNNLSNMNNKNNWRVNYIGKLQEKINFIEKRLLAAQDQLTTLKYRKNTQEEQKKWKSLCSFYLNELFDLDREIKRSMEK